MSRVGALGVVCLLALAAGCTSEDKTTDLGPDCRRIRDRVVDLQIDKRLRGQSVSGRRAAEVEKHRKNLRASLGDGFLESCARKGEDYVECVLTAEDAADVTRCEKEAAR